MDRFWAEELQSRHRLSEASQSCFCAVSLDYRLERLLLRRMSSLVARNRHAEVVAACPFSGDERTQLGCRPRTVDDSKVDVGVVPVPISPNFSEFLCNFVRRRRGWMVGLLPALPILGHRPIVNGRWYEPKPECDRRRRRTFRSYRESGTAWDYKPGGHCRTHSTRSSPGRCARPNDAYAAEHQCLWPELSAFLHRLYRLDCSELMPHSSWHPTPRR